jgi:cell wall-associated NlpC family hydrolase
MRAWERGGVYLPHLASAQYRMSKKVSFDAMRPGDLVFFADGGAIYHVGIFIGGGQMIEAPFTGANVRISSIWRDSLYAAARP